MSLMANITVWILGIELFHMMCMLIIVQSRTYATKMTEYINIIFQDFR